MRSLVSPARRAGFTLIEIMIAMLIGVIGIVVMMQTFAISEGFKRTATSGTDAQINGGVGLYMMEREIRMAGYGFTNMLAMGCNTVRVWNSTSGTGYDLSLKPVEINPAGLLAPDPNTDTIVVAYGTADSFASGVAADQPTGTATEKFVLYGNYAGFKNGDIFVSVQPGGGAASCVLHEASASVSAAGNCGVPPTAPNAANSVAHDAILYKNAYGNCNNKNATHNSASGIKDAGGTVVPAVRRASGGTLFNLGGAPVIKVYAVRGGNLTICDLNLTSCTNPADYQTVVEGIVSLRAVYGKDFVPAVNSQQGDGVVDTWDRAALANSFQAARVLSVMLELTARSSLKEKPSSGTTCDTTTLQGRPDKTQDWIGNAYVGIDLSTSDPDWRCYRYKLYQTVVPLRNTIWRPL